MKDINQLRDKLAQKHASPYHDTSQCREIAFKAGWDAAIDNSGKLVKRLGDQAVALSEMNKKIDLKFIFTSV